PALGIRLVGIVGGRFISQLNSTFRSIYQPSNSVRIFPGLQALGEELTDVELFTCRAVNPNISLRSPVSTELVTYSTTPPERPGVVGASAWAAGVVVEPGWPVSIWVMTYFFVVSLIWRVRFRSHCV